MNFSYYSNLFSNRIDILYQSPYQLKDKGEYFNIKEEPSYRLKEKKSELLQNDTIALYAYLYREYEDLILHILLDNKYILKYDSQASFKRYYKSYLLKPVREQTLEEKSYVYLIKTFPYSLISLELKRRELSGR